jgi:hypothetical protein
MAKLIKIRKIIRRDHSFDYFLVRPLFRAKVIFTHILCCANKNLRLFWSMGKCHFYFIISFFLPALLMGQQPSWEIAPSIHYGAVFRQEINDPLLHLTHLRGMDLNFRSISKGKMAWEKHLNFPSREITLAWYDYGQPQVLGQSLMATFGLQFPVLKKLKWSIGNGIAYSSKINHPLENPRNKAISTRISLAIKTDLQYPFRISPRLNGFGSFSFRHFSNGNIKKPNYGLNFLMASFGINYKLYKEKPKMVKNDSSHELSNERIRFHLMFNRGWKNPSHFVETRFRVNALSLFVSKKFTSVNSWTVGLDGFYDTSLYVEYWHQKDTKPPFEADNFIKQQAGFTLGHLLHLGKFDFVTTAGYLFYLPYDFHSRLYQRYGFRYHPCRFVFANATLKAYRGTADLLEFGLGLTF